MTQSNCLEVTIRFLSRTLFESLHSSSCGHHPSVHSSSHLFLSLSIFLHFLSISVYSFIHPTIQPSFVLFSILLPTPIYIANHSLKLLFISPSLLPFSFSQPCIHPPTIQPVIRQPSIHFRLSIFSFHLFLLPLHSPLN